MTLTLVFHWKKTRDLRRRFVFVTTETRGHNFHHLGTPIVLRSFKLVWFAARTVAVDGLRSVLIRLSCIWQCHESTCFRITCPFARQDRSFSDLGNHAVPVGRLHSTLRSKFCHLQEAQTNHVSALSWSYATELRTAKNIPGSLEP